MDKAIKGLKNKLELNGIPVLELNLYDITLDLLTQELGEGEIFELEKTMDKAEFKVALQSILDIQEVLLPKIKSMIDSPMPKFISWVSACLPLHPFPQCFKQLSKRCKSIPPWHS